QSLISFSTDTTPTEIYTLSLHDALPIFKATQQNKYLPTKQTVGATPFAPDLPTLMNYCDLDPHYTDAYGDPVSRLTYDWTPNPYNGATYLVNQIKIILDQMGATNVTVGSTVAPYSAHNDWWG